MRSQIFGYFIFVSLQTIVNYRTQSFWIEFKYVLGPWCSIHIQNSEYLHAFMAYSTGHIGELWWNYKGHVRQKLSCTSSINML